MPKVTSSQHGRLNGRFVISALFCLRFGTRFILDLKPLNRSLVIEKELML